MVGLKKSTDFKLDQVVKFTFLGSELIGKVTRIDEKENRIQIMTSDGIYHQAGMDDKESRFCYIL
jgi:hypothetical protein